MIKKSLKKIIAISLVTISMFALSACGNSKSSSDSKSAAVEKIKKSGKLVLGTSADFPPYEFHKSVNGKDEIVGFDIEIAKQIAKDLGVKLEVKDMKFDGLLASLNQGKVDLVLSGMTPTEERKKNVDFSDLYYTSVQSIVVKKADKDKFKTAKDLDGKKIGVQKGSIQEGIAKKQVPGAERVGLGKVSDLILALNTNRVDSTLVELPVATSYVKANKDLVVSDIKVDAEEAGSAVAVKKGNSDLVKEINKTLDRLKKEKAVDKYVTEASKLADQ